MKFHKNVVIFDIDGVPVIGNFSTGSLIGLTSDGSTFCKQIKEEGLHDKIVPDCRAELFDALKKGRFFEDDAQDQVSCGLASAYLHLTQRCNLHCIGCYSKDCNRNHLADPPLEKVKCALEQLALNGCKQVVFSGGEPFLRDDLADILRYAKEVGIPGLHIITNGTKVTTQALEQIKPYVSGVAISIDGYCAESPTFIRDKGIFGSVIHAIEMCRDSGIETSILPTIHAKNYDCMPKYVELSKQFNVQISFSLLTCSPMDEALGRWLPSPKELSVIAMDLINIGLEGNVSINDMPIGGGLDVRKSCEVGSKIISIDADGTVYPCHMLHDPALAMGNIFNSNLSEILDCQLAQHCRSLHVDSFETCKDCKHRYICGGGCRARSFYVHKNLTSHDFYCPMTMTYFDWISKNISNTYG